MSYFRNSLPMLLLTCVFIFSLFTPNLQAERADVKEADQVCQNWLDRVVSDKGSWADVALPYITDISELKANDTVLAYCYNINPEGYVIVPTLKELPPIKAYSEEGTFNVADTGGMVQLIREILQNRFRVYVDNYGSLEASQPADGQVLLGREHHQKWDQLNVSREEFRGNLEKDNLETMETVGPLLTTSWHQSYPYNILCPAGDGGTCVVGCVATAASQILAYHQWPPDGVGSETYYWSGDNSCESSTSGKQLSADFTDPYDWDNMPDRCGSCNGDQVAAVAELCYEVAVAFHMDFGVCGSGAYTADALDVFPDHFRYHRETIQKQDRANHTAYSWFSLILNEINANRPMQYRIYSHSIVCDGWQTEGTTNMVHFNYGWGGSYNTWVAVDNLYCPWAGCDTNEEYMIRGIEPDRGVNFQADANVGWVPYDVQFTGVSELVVDTWHWTFGDGEESFEQDPLHTYELPGTYDVTLEVDAGGDIRSYSRADFIVGLADTVNSFDTAGKMDSIIGIPIRVNSNIALNRIQLPVEFGGDVGLQYQGYDVTGYMGELFDNFSYINYDGNNKRMTLDFVSTVGEVPPSNDTLIVLNFKVNSTSSPTATTPIILDGYLSYEPKFYGDLAEYTPMIYGSTVSYLGCCIGMTGNTNCSEEEYPDISDIVRLIDYLYLSKEPLCCPEEADCNGIGGLEPDIADIVSLIKFLYQDGEDLASCP